MGEKGGLMVRLLRLECCREREREREKERERVCVFVIESMRIVASYALPCLVSRILLQPLASVFNDSQTQKAEPPHPPPPPPPQPKNKKEKKKKILFF